MFRTLGILGVVAMAVAAIASPSSAVPAATASGQLAPRNIRLYQADKRYTYRIELLRLVLEKTKSTPTDAYEISFPYQDLSQARGLYMLNSGAIDVATVATSRERESLYLPIKICLLRGLLGLRLLLIRADDMPAFANINTLSDLRQKIGGSSPDWADAAILRRSGIKVDGSYNYKLLFTMLGGKRFDFFPRGINEIWEEFADLKAGPNKIVVEPHLAIFYPYPVYFFVRKGNVELARRIEKGLTMALNDGSFRDLFLRHHKSHLERANVKNRVVIKIENPEYDAATPLDTGWWDQGVQLLRP